jgi:hypothetical protein
MTVERKGRKFSAINSSAGGLICPRKVSPIYVSARKFRIVSVIILSSARNESKNFHVLHCLRIALLFITARGSDISILQISRSAIPEIFRLDYAQRISLRASHSQLFIGLSKLSNTNILYIAVQRFIQVMR